jgi:hypothetical protein
MNKGLSKKVKVSNRKLVKLAAKHRPPQSWYDDLTDSTKPERRIAKSAKRQR